MCNTGTILRKTLCIEETVENKMILNCAYTCNNDYTTTTISN